ncbi:hypothetical protein KSF_095550 [Reticulibacter mediterranei]|uniref:Uncharacterized protein n=1 Tax=Reticulibacter mediterranei TaxID=2778369 RepID=A0A8J3IZA1_9CHLR|nr:hypothetical protein [Reticulibacter mediterranei]GHO99507.1 hypothetical protein KSF_095550 [Reticulibacter mediterranei]
MDRQDIINAAKDTLLTAATVPTSFFVDCRERPLGEMAMVPCPCGQCDGAITPPACFKAGRHMANEQHWNSGDVQEIGMVAIEKQEGKEALIIAFCEAAKPKPVCTLHRIDIRRLPTGGIVLLDNEETTTEVPRLLLWFFTGVMTSAALPLEIVMVLVSLEEGGR